MKILHVNSYYVSRELYKNIYDYQVRNGNEIDVFVPVKKNRVPGNFERGSYTKISYDFTEFDRYIFHLKHLKIYKDIKKKYPYMNYDITHAHSLFSNGYIAYKLKQEFGIPYVVIVRNTDVNVFFKKLFYLKNLGNKIMLNSEQVVFLSEAYKEYVNKRYVYEKFRTEINNKSTVIPNGIDAFWYKNRIKDAKKINPENALRIISVGTLDKNKNFETSRKVIEELASKGVSVRWTVIGKIIDKNVYKNIIDCPYIIYKQFMDKEMLIKEYDENDILLVPSVNETFGLVYAEAMTQGLPVIYTKGQGFDRQFKDGLVGYAVDCFNYKEIADKILLTLENYTDISNNCLLKCRKFDWEVINERYMELYGAVLNNHKKTLNIV